MVGKLKSCLMVIAAASCIISATYWLKQWCNGHDGVILRDGVTPQFEVQRNISIQWTEEMMRGVPHNPHDKISIRLPHGELDRRKVFPYAEHRTSPLATRIIYNRVPKCASSTVLTVFGILAKRNQISSIHSIVYKVPSLETVEEANLVDNLDQMATPWLYDRHIKFLNFTAYQHSMPEYINVFRDPIERRRSLYYFRNRDNHTFMSYEERVLKRLSAGLKASPPDFAMHYFCGMNQCNEDNDDITLQIAKQNVERYYRVVGVMDDLESFFRLLEHHFPEMFRGAVDVYRTTKPQNVDANRTSHAVTNATRDLLRKQFAQEYEFYEFVKQRLANAKRLANIV